MKITSLPPTPPRLPSTPMGVGDRSPVDQFVKSSPRLRNLDGPKIVGGCVGAFMGAIPLAGAGVNALAGLLSNSSPEGMGALGMLANLGGTLALFSGHPVIGGLGLAASATSAFLLYTDDFR